MAWYMAALPALTPIILSKSRRVGERGAVCFSIGVTYHMKYCGNQGFPEPKRAVIPVFILYS
jgi:hypothetical protein